LKIKELGRTSIIKLAYINRRISLELKKVLRDLICPKKQSPTLKDMSSVMVCGTPIVGLSYARDILGEQYFLHN